MSQFTIRRVNQIPATIEPSTMYILKRGTTPVAEVFFSNADGTQLVPGITEQFIEDKFASLVNAGIGQIQVVDTIAERDALEKVSNTFILVIDATGDEYGTTGTALYLYRATAQTYYRISVFDNSGDAASDIPRWDIIQGRPDSTPNEIDQAVAASHAHENIGTLNRLSVGEQGELLLDGEPVCGIKMLPGDW